MNKENMNDLKRRTMERLRTAEKAYSIVSLCTKMPYVECAEETYDDQIYIYFEKENAEKAAKGLIAKKIPVQLVELANKAFLAFYNNLFLMGVNCIAVNKGSEEECFIQLNELLKRKDLSKLPEGTVIIENPELNLTAAYYMQESKREPSVRDEEMLKELHEEMLSHFQKGRYLVPVREGGGIPILKQKDGSLFHPLFTDAYEFQKFCAVHKDETFKMHVIEAKNLAKALPPQAAGVALNPFGVNLQLHLKVTQNA